MLSSKNVSLSSTNFRDFLNSVWLAIRPKTLTAAMAPLVASTALVCGLGYPVNWIVIICAGLCSLSIQIATNLINDAIDFKKGADTHERLGPVRVTQSGLMSSQHVMFTGILFLLFAMFCGIPLVAIGGKPIIAIGVVSIFLAYAYTGGPFPLAYLGLGDVFVVLFFGVIAVSGLVFLQTGNWLWESVVAGLQVGFLATVLIAVNNARDIVGDKLVHKRTLAVRWGVQFVRWEIALLFLSTLAMNIFWVWKHNWWGVWLTLLAIPTMVQVLNIVWRNSPSAVYNRALALSAKVHAMFTVLLSIGIFCSLYKFG